ncbi:MAG TPA: DUF3300 domain-containing protein [Terriglobia bacterium]|nr:DUF3300 domain-containing protein [Terriglobia bacterium]
MNIFGRFREFKKTRWAVQILVSLLWPGLLFTIWPQNVSAYQDAPPPPQAAPPGAPAPPYTQQTPEQLQQLVAPIALYPDSLVAQILAASTFPDQVVEADRWMQEHPGLQGDALGQAVDQQPWDPSVKALTAFPSVLGNMDKNLSWTSSLGDAYYNQQQDVMESIQVMRQRAQQAGNLRTTPQQVVTTQGPTIIVQPANPEVVYVPAYDPWVVYGGPVMAWPGWYPYPGIWYSGPYLSFGIGFGIGFFGGFGWGWNHWGFDWHNHYATFDRGRYYSRSTTFYNRNAYYRGGGARGRPYYAGGGARGAFDGNRPAARGYAAPRGETGARSGAFSGIERGGQIRTYSSRGSASMGGGFARGGGGGRH